MTRVSRTRPCATRAALVFTPPISQPKVLFIPRTAGWRSRAGNPGARPRVGSGGACEPRPARCVRPRAVGAGPRGRGRGAPLAWARAFRERLACDEWYVADLDALAGGAPPRALVRALVGVGGRLLLDSGAANPAQAREGVSDGAARVV